MEQNDQVWQALLNSLSDGFVNEIQIIRSQFDTENQPDYTADATQPFMVQPPPGLWRERNHNFTHMPFRSRCEICLRAKSRGNLRKGNLTSRNKEHYYAMIFHYIHYDILWELLSIASTYN
eukprot:1114851-Amphidinium_carterae.1